MMVAAMAATANARGRDGDGDVKEAAKNLPTVTQEEPEQVQVSKSSIRTAGTDVETGPQALILAHSITESPLNSSIFGTSLKFAINLMSFIPRKKKEFLDNFRILDHKTF